MFFYSIIITYDIIKMVIKMSKHNHSSKENIRIAFLLNLLFSFIELIGGFITNSMSILSDSIHDFGDAISIGVSYFLEKKSEKKSDNKYTYGYLRYSLLGAIITSVILFTGSIIVIYNAILRIITPEEINYDAMIIFAIFGVIINCYTAYRTSHSQKHNEKVINLHMLEDAIGWIIVLIGSICMKIFNISIIDSILSIILAFYILFHVYKYIKEVFYIFMETVPNDIDLNELEKDIEKEFNLKSIHHIHIWSLDGINNFMTAHVQLKEDLNKKETIELKNNIKEYVKKYDINHLTIEIEFHDENCESKKH